MTMNLNKKIVAVSLALLILLLVGCSDDFLREKKNYGSTNEALYDNYEGAKGRVNYLYKLLLPIENGGSAVNFTIFFTGNNDDQSDSTEEYANGLSLFTDNTIILDYDHDDMVDYFHQEKKITAPWGVIRNTNDVIWGISNSTGLSQEQKEELLGQAYFFRAWAYWRLVVLYGGVPIIDYPQNPTLEEDLGVPRATTKESIDFICENLKLAADYLPSEWASTDYGRITKGAALALMGRARLHYASPLYNRADDADRWELAYEANKAAMEETMYSLTPGTNASGWAEALASYSHNEAVFFTLHNTIDNKNSNFGKNNHWENSIRPGNLKVGAGSNSGPTSQIIDLFPMSDGKIPYEVSSDYTSLTVSSIDYDPDRFFLNRDPRFYRTFAFPGVTWKADGVSMEATALYPYANGNEYELWSYAWKAAGNTELRGFYADGLAEREARSLFIRKRSNDTEITPALYNWDSSNGFKVSGAPLVEIRVGEILLNFAEAACGANKLSEAMDALIEIRRRVGYTAANNYGLDETLTSSRARMFAAILYERQIELAYEGKRYDDMRRWLLWDGGATLPNGAPSSWLPSGWNGNTCTYLGMTPFNGTIRTEIQMLANETANENTADDPLKAARPAGVSMNSDLTPSENIYNEEVDEDKIKPIERLARFYRNNLKREVLNTDPRSVQFDPRYYFLGLRSSAMSTNSGVIVQTIGWTSYYGDAPGTYDPIAE